MCWISLFARAIYISASILVRGGGTLSGEGKTKYQERSLNYLLPVQIFNFISVIQIWTSSRSSNSSNTGPAPCWKWTIRFQVKTPKLFQWIMFICRLLSYILNFQKMSPREFWANLFLRNSRNQVHSQVLN